MKHYAILTGGPSLRKHWWEGKGNVFAEVWAINTVGAKFSHDYSCHLDRAETIGIGSDGWGGKTLKGVYHPAPEEVREFDPDCSISFPFFLAKMLRETPADSLIYIYGWDCSGTGIDGVEWSNSRNTQERILASRYWQRSKIGRVFGGMDKWAGKMLGYYDTPVMDREVLEEIR